MRHPILLTACLLVFTASAFSQAMDTFVAFNQASVQSGTARLHHFDGSGKILGILASFPTFAKPVQMAVSADNRAIMVLTAPVGTTLHGCIIYRVNYTGGATTFFKHPSILYPDHMFLDQDGSWIIGESPPGVPSRNIRYYRVQNGNLTALGFVANVQVDGFMRSPYRHGIVARATTQTYPTIGAAYLHIDHRTGKVTTFSPNGYFWGMVGARNLQYDPISGGLIDTSQPPMGQLVMYRVRSGANHQLLPSVNFQASPRDLAAPSQRNVGFHFYLFGPATISGRTNFAIHQVRNDGKLVRQSAIQGNPPFFATPMLRVGSRQLHWSLDKAPNDRSLHLDYPGEHGYPYVVGLSYTGFHPGVPLPDKRVIPIVPDALTQLSLAGGVPGLIRGTVGRLDTSGRARVQIFGNKLGSIVQGLSICATAAVLDSTAPCGIAWINGPERVTFQ